MTATAAPSDLTQPEFRRWLEQLPAADINHYELIHGRIVMSPPAGWPHAGLAENLIALLWSHVRSEKLGIVLDSSAGYDLPSGDTVEPDASFISAERFAAGPQPQRGRFLRIVPNLVVEILSPTTKRRDEWEKKDIYGANGVDEYWIVDSDGHGITVFFRGEHGYGPGTRFSTGRVASRVLPALTISVEDVLTV